MPLRGGGTSMAGSRLARGHLETSEPLGADARSTGDRFEWVGNHPAFDFTNTVDWTSRGLESERLRSFDDLVRWALAAGAIGLPEAAALGARAGREPRRASEALRRARELRSEIHEVMTAIARSAPPPPAALRAFNEAVRTAVSSLSVASDGGRMAWRHDDTGTLDLVAHHVAWLAAQLMTSQDAAPVGLCANPECGWLFLDTTKNHSRRWCGMPDCGPRAKARRYYMRRRGKERP